MIVLDELVESYGFLDQDQRAQDWLRDEGVSHLAGIEWPGPIGIARIQTHRDGLFEFNDDGVKTFVMPVTAAGRYSDIVDALAFRPADPSTVWLHQGSVSVLGDITTIDPDRLVRIYPTPLDWLVAGGAGLVVLDQLGAASLLRMLTEDGPGVLFGREAYHDVLDLERLLIGPPRPCLKIFFQAEKELETV